MRRVFIILIMILLVTTLVSGCTENENEEKKKTYSDTVNFPYDDEYSRSIPLKDGDSVSWEWESNDELVFQIHVWVDVRYEFTGISDYDNLDIEEDETFTFRWLENSGWEPMDGSEIELTYTIEVTSK
jgi:hypothetical protein